MINTPRFHDKGCGFLLWPVKSTYRELWPKKKEKTTTAKNTHKESFTLGVWNQQVDPIRYKLDKQQGPAV